MTSPLQATAGVGTVPAEDAAIIRLCAHLPRLATMAFIARPGPDSATQWAGHGRARLDVEPGPDGWRVTERGRFRPAGAPRSVGFSNVYHWQPVGTGLVLAHERFGRSAPVTLVYLVPTGPGQLASRQPHLCGADRYNARLDLLDSGFTLHWQIDGPAKQERLTYRYRCTRR